MSIRGVKIDASHELGLLCFSRHISARPSEIGLLKYPAIYYRGMPIQYSADTNETFIWTSHKLLALHICGR